MLSSGDATNDGLNLLILSIYIVPMLSNSIKKKKNYNHVQKETHLHSQKVVWLADV